MSGMSDGLEESRWANFYQCWNGTIVSVIDEVSQLLWPGVWAIVIPPVLFVPPVKVDDSWGKVPCESLKTASDDQEWDSEADVLPESAAVKRIGWIRFSAADDKENEGKEYEKPGDRDDPGDRSVVNLLHDARGLILDVGKEPEDAKYIKWSSRY